MSKWPKVPNCRAGAGAGAGARTRQPEGEEEEPEEEEEEKEKEDEEEGGRREMRVSAGTHTCPLFASRARAAGRATGTIRKHEDTGKFSSIRRVEDAKNSSRKQGHRGRRS